MVSTTGNGKYKKVYARIYANKSGKVNCNLSERKEIDGVYKRKKTDVNELIDEPFKGFFVLRIYRIYVGTSKTITLSVEEIIGYRFTDLPAKKSYFDEFESGDEG